MMYKIAVISFLIFLNGINNAENLCATKIIQETDNLTTEDKLGGNGTWVPAVADEFSSVLLITHKKSRCTASLIAPNVVLTAAHCLSGKKPSIRYTRKANTRDGPIDITITANCTIYSGYAKKKKKDYALCKANNGDYKFAINTYDSIVTDLSKLKVSNYLLLSGYGCKKTANEITNTKFLIGKAQINSLPNSNNDRIETKKVDTNKKEGAILCPGDSGGPAYYLPNFKTISGRKIVGVNSAVSYYCNHISLDKIDPATGNKMCSASDEESDCPLCFTPKDKSYIASLTSSSFINFINSWAKTNEVEICGLNNGFKDNKDIICR